VGSNSVKLLLAEVTGRHVEPLVEKSEQTRLGDGSFETNQLQLAAIAHTARAVAEFAKEARAAKATAIRVIANQRRAAMRSIPRN